MRTMALTRPGAGRLESVELPVRPLGSDDVRIHVLACGVCRTDLHVVDGELPAPAIPIVPGHEIIGRVAESGANVAGLPVRTRVGIPWLAYTCGTCEYCRDGLENLCPNARFTGYQVNGGYAEEVVADARSCFRVPDNYDDEHAAPLLCAGLIGYRAYRMQRAPRARRDRLWSPGLLVRAYLFLGSIEAAAAMTAFAFVLLGAGWRWGVDLTAADALYRRATTACLTTIVLMQVVNVHLCRSRRRSSLGRPLFDNRLITIGIVAELVLILLIDYTAAGNAVFGTLPLGYEIWLGALPFAAAMLAFEEIRKGLVRRRSVSLAEVLPRAERASLHRGTNPGLDHVRERGAR